MTIQIIKRHMVGGQGHEHIAEIQWLDASTGKTDKASRETMVTWLDDKEKSNKATVRGQDGSTSWVGTRHPTGRPAYLQTHADGNWNDNLLALETY